MIETLITAAEEVEAVLPQGEGIQEVVADKGYYSTERIVDMEQIGLRSYVSEPKQRSASGCLWKQKEGPRQAGKGTAPTTRRTSGTAICASL